MIKPFTQGMKDYHVVDWSPSQKCFHLEMLSEMLRDNLSVFRGESMTDYLCVGIFETYEEASKYIQKMWKVYDAKQPEVQNADSV